MNLKHAALAAFLSATLIGCSGGGGNGGATARTSTALDTFPTGTPNGPVVNFAFSAHQLPGIDGTAVISYMSPPYQVGTANDGKGNLSVLDYNALGITPIFTWPRVPYDMRVADFNGDGIPDLISDVYTPTNVASAALLYFGNADGTFTQDTTFGAQYVGTDGQSGFLGRTETVVVADFNNDGAVDVFLPTYSFLDGTYDLSGEPTVFESPGPPPNVHNAKQSFLLLNDGTGKFAERAVQAGIGMHSVISGLTPASTDPNGMQPEGVQAVDFNMDGLIDLYVGGHLFINQGVDAQGVPHFKDMAATWGLTDAVLRAAPLWATDSANAIQSNERVTDEGAKFMDWNNDGHLDLLLFRWNWGPAHGARLFEFSGSQFVERTQELTSTTATCTNPPSKPVAFFYSSRPTTMDSNAAGINAYDLDNDGLEDVVVSGDETGPAIFRNNGCGFVEVSAGDLDGVQGGSGGMAFADFDGDGGMDIVYPTPAGIAYYTNKTSPRGASFTVEVVGPNGEHNQFGRVVQVLPPGTKQIFTRVVDGGSGYLSQSQYPLLIGTPFSGQHTVKVYFAPLTACVYGGAPCQPAILSFTISPGQRATAYAPSSASPTGKAVVN